MITTEPNSIIISPPEPSPKRISPVQVWINDHLVETIGSAVVISLLCLGISASNIFTAYRGFKDTITKQFQLQELSEKIVYLDEVLTMSARMAASTGQSSWLQRYNDNVKVLEETIRKLETLAPSYKQDTEQTTVANNELIRIEQEAFDLISRGQKEEALRRLLSKDYDIQKGIYAGGVKNALANIKQEMEQQINVYSNRLYRSLLFAIISFPILIVSWVIIGLQVRTYIVEGKKSQQALELSNEELKSKEQALIETEKTQSEENELLQSDIENILDVVLDLESGNFIVEAQVNERATGLVADTLNRLIEELNRTLLQVLNVSQQVSIGAGELEKLAVSTVDRSQQQAKSVIQVQELMNNVTTLAQTAAKESDIANQTIQESSLVVDQGQQAMLIMTEGITALQEGREQIIKRAETLSDFVELITQFVRDQQRVAALTRVLAFNASMIAQRATTGSDLRSSGETSAEELAVVVREFDIIANQINELATETNQSLGILLQRTEQLQIVASGLNEDVKDINELVNNFTQGVGRSTEIFTTIKQVTQQLEIVQQKVSESSQAIADSAQNTLNAVTDIALASRDTQESALVTRNQSTSLEELAQKLLERVNVFKLKTLDD